MNKQCWMVKQEPESYGWDDFVRDGGTAWTGVRSYPARLNLRAMKKGDEVLYYHSVTGKCVVGICKVAREAYADPTAEEGDWACVDLVPVKALKHPVTLAAIKARKELSGMTLLRQSRLSVVPVTAEEFGTIVAMSAKPAG